MICSTNFAGPNHYICTAKKGCEKSFMKKFHEKRTLSGMKPESVLLFAEKFSQPFRRGRPCEAHLFYDQYRTALIGVL